MRCVDIFSQYVVNNTCITSSTYPYIIMVRLIEPTQLTYQVQAFFQSAFRMNDIQTVKRLLKHHRESINVDTNTSHQGISLLHQCVVQQNKSMMSVLIRAGADINTVDRNGWSCLHTAARSGNYQVCEYLLRKGADPMVYTSSKELPVDFSTHSLVTYLLVDVMQQHGHVAIARYHLSRAVAQQRQEVALDQMKHDDDNNHTDDDSVFNQSVKTGNSILKKRRSSKSSLSRCSWSSSTSASSSASSDSEAETSSLRSSASLSSSTSSRLSVQFSTNTLFLNYVHENEHELLDVLLGQNDISILNKLDRKGLSTIHWASINGFDECVRVLAKHGADVDIVDPNGWTPLHGAVITGNIESVDELLTNGASVYAVTNSGETVFDMTNNGHMRKLLTSHVGNNMTAKDMKKSVL